MAENNYAGELLTMESFTDQTTDGSGDITVVLQNTPAADEAIMVNLQGVAGAFAQFKERTTTSVTFTVFQKYDKISSGDSVTDLPASVTAVNTAGGPVIASTAYGHSAASVGVGSGNEYNMGAATSHAHNTTINKISDHSHTTTETALNTLNSTGSITLVVTYAF